MFKLITTTMALIPYLGSLAQASEFSFLSENNLANNQVGFIKNNGQILDINGQQRPDIFFQSVHSSPNSFYLKDKIAFVYSLRTKQEGSIKFKENEKLIKLNVYDLLGLLIISVDNPNSNIDLTSLQEGIYLIETIDTNGVSSFIKLSKNH